MGTRLRMNFLRKHLAPLDRFLLFLSLPALEILLSTVIYQKKVVGLAPTPFILLCRDREKDTGATAIPYYAFFRIIFFISLTSSICSNAASAR